MFKGQNIRLVKPDYHFAAVYGLILHNNFIWWMKFISRPVRFILHHFNHSFNIYLIPHIKTHPADCLLGTILVAYFHTQVIDISSFDRHFCQPMHILVCLIYEISVDLLNVNWYTTSIYIYINLKTTKSGDAHFSLEKMFGENNSPLINKYFLRLLRVHSSLGFTSTSQNSCTKFMSVTGLIVNARIVRWSVHGASQC